MKYKDLLSLLESEYDVQVGGASGVRRSAHSDYGTHRVENNAMIGRINAFINRHLSEACLEPKQVLFGLRQKLNTIGLDFNFTTKDSIEEGMKELPLTRFGGIFGKSVNTPYDEFDNEDGLESILGHGLSLQIETYLDENGLYKMEGKVVPTITEDTDGEVDEEEEYEDEDEDDLDESVELDELKMPATNKYGEYKSGKVRKAALAGSRRAAQQSNDELRGAFKSRPTGDFDASRRAGKRSSERLSRVVNAKGRDAEARKKESEKAQQKVGAGKRRRFSIVSSHEPEGDQIDELNKSTLQSYATKALRRALDGDKSRNPETRKRGVEKAMRRLTGHRAHQLGYDSPETRKAASRVNDDAPKRKI